MISIPKTSRVSERLSSSNGANSRVCFYFHTHLFTYTHTHSFGSERERERDKIEKLAELVSCLELTTSVRLHLPPALLQHSTDVIWGRSLWLPPLFSLSLSLSLFPSSIMLYSLWTLGGAGEGKMSIEQP